MYSIGYVPGVFDLLHKGHLNLLTAARVQCAVLVVGIVSDEGTYAYKHRMPVQDEGTRRDVVQSLRIVDFAVHQPTTDPSPVVTLIRPEVLFHGDDWERLLVGHETLDRLGIAFVRLPYTQGVSTSALIEAARAGSDARWKGAA